VGPSPGARFVRDLAVLFGVPAIIVALLLWHWHPWTVDRYEAGPSEDIFRVVAGTWDWETDSVPCGEMTHTISFSADHRLLFLNAETPWTGPDGGKHSSAEYEIRDVSRSHIRGFMRGETRRTSTGALVVWDLVLTSPNSYAWRRTDWWPSNLTEQITRCPVRVAPDSGRKDRLVIDSNPP
jgi:hypothetical protein